MLLFVITFLIGLNDYGATDSLDGALLSNELKKIKDGVGITYMQEQYNSFPYETATETGSQLLQNIQNSLDSSLTDLNKVLFETRSKITQAQTPDVAFTTLPNCCSLPDDQLTYVPEFQTKVNFDTACVTTSTIDVSDVKYPPDILGTTMKTDYEKNKNILWQHYSTTKGVSVIYPATKWANCENFDPRFTSHYAAAESPKAKDVVIILDTSSSMKQPSGLPDKTRIVIAKEAVNNVIQTLKPDDRVGIVRFDSTALTPTGTSYHSCYQNELSFATKENTDKIKQYVFSISASNTAESNFENALVKAFAFFKNSSEDTVSIDSRDQVIMFLSDGKSSSVTNPVQVIADENKRLQNKIIVYTYLIGDEQEAKTQLEQMAQQTLTDTMYGDKRTGVFKYFDQTMQKYLSTEMATFHINLNTGGQTDKSTFTVPYVDPYSGVGLITSLCLPVYVISGLHGVICTDVKLSELLTEVEYFSEDEYSFAFIIDGTGRVLMHPLLPNAAFVRKDEDPVLVDISVLERSPEAASVIESMKSGGTGTKSFFKYFTRPRGFLVNEGSTHISKNATFFWGPVPQSNFSLCVVLVDDAYSEVKEANFQISNTDLPNVFMYHNRSIRTDDFDECKFYKRRVTLDRSCVKFAPSAFSNPFQYLDRDETPANVATYKLFLTKQATTNPGFRPTLRSSVWATYRAEKYWKQHPAKYVAWRYIATKAGLIRIYPGVQLEKSYDHQKRPWWRQVLAHPNTMLLTPPYVDAWGSGIVLSFQHTIYKAGSNKITAVAGADFPLEYLTWFINHVYPSCENGYKCIILDDSGFIVVHPRLKETTDESQFQEPKHVSVEEPAIAELMTSKGVLNFNECQDFSENKNLRSYRVTLPSGMEGGLNFKDTNDHFELREIPESNLFIIRVQKQPSSTCSCDGSKSPDVFECPSSSSANCNCLCHHNIVYDVCANRYDTSLASLPCSARLPDTSGISEPDFTTGLQACYIPICHLKQSKTTCFSEAECSWCEYTDAGLILPTPCCRLKEECTFGKTKYSSRDTCSPSTVPNTPEKATADDTSKIGGIIGGSIAGGIILTLVVLGGVYYFRNYRDKEPTDPYIDAVPDRSDLPQYTEKDESKDGKNVHAHPNVYFHSVGDNF